MNTKSENNLKLAVFSGALGFTAVVVIWIFLKIMSEGMALIWEDLPAAVNLPYYTISACTAGGLITGLFRKKFGDYPEELNVVLGKIKNEKKYDYGNMAVMIAGALLPLLAGSSIGPEAGMTGIIAGLCYWTSDNIKSAGVSTREYSEIGSAVTLGILFHSPLFGIFAVEENSNDTMPSLKKGNKIFLYGLAITGGTCSYMLLNHLFGAPMSGFPSFENGHLPETKDYMMIILYIAAGFILAFFYEHVHNITIKAGNILPSVISETLAGLLLGITGTFVPAVMFSGEEQMAELMESYTQYLPWMLIGLAFLKLLLTNICINFGMKGGHFFPVIFAGVSMGYGIALFTGTNVVLAAAVVTATLLGCIMKKPIAVTMLLFICFPVKMFIWLFLGAVTGSRLFPEKEKSHSPAAE